MSNKPTLGISNFMLEGFMNNGQPVRMRASGWINPSKDDKFDQTKLAIVEQIKKMIIDNNLQISVKIDAKHGDEPQNWPKIGTMTLFANVPRGDAQPQYQAPQAQHQAPPAPMAPAPMAPAPQQYYQQPPAPQPPAYGQPPAPQPAYGQPPVPPMPSDEIPF